MKKLDSGVNFTRFQLGDLTVIALRDGYVDLPVDRLRRSDGSAFGDDLPGEVARVDGRLRLSVNAFLVIEGERHLLIDTGAGSYWDATMGRLFEALAEAGINRDRITTVAVTHTHEDHVNGLLDLDNNPAFLRLERIFVPERELPLFGQYERLAIFRSLIVPLAWGDSVGNGTTAVRADGHEVGHTAYEVVSGEERLLICGDVIHVPSIQFARPELTWGADSDQVLARQTREALLSRAAEAGFPIAGAHIDFPGIGTVDARGRGYAFRPSHQGDPGEPASGFRR